MNLNFIVKRGNKARNIFRLHPTSFDIYYNKESQNNEKEYNGTLFEMFH